MFCSTVIPTIGRAELSRAVESVLSQNFTPNNFEIIVVNDSGQPLARADWKQSQRVQVIHTNRRERCAARNAGAALARGDYLHFLDDDDWLLPNALESFWMLAQKRSDAAWLYGSSQLVDRAGHPIIQLHHQMNGNVFVQVMAGEWIPLQASLIQSEVFFAVGGFHPLLLATEDIDLCRRIALRGDMAGMPETVASIGMGIEGSATNYARSSEYNRWARERILSESGVFARMRSSASSSDWHGRIVRSYITSAVWNLQRRQLFTSASRATFGLAGLALSGRHIFSRHFWRAIARSYDSETFLRGFREANRPVERRIINTESVSHNWSRKLSNRGR